MSQNTPRVEVRLPATSTGRRYPIYIGQGTLQQGEILPTLLGDRDVCLVTNETVGPLYEALVLESLGDQRKVTRVLLPIRRLNRLVQSSPQRLKISRSGAVFLLPWAAVSLVTSLVLPQPLFCEARTLSKFPRHCWRKLTRLWVGRLRSITPWVKTLSVHFTSLLG